MECCRWDEVSMDLSMGEILGESRMWNNLRDIGEGIRMYILMI